MLEYIEPIKNAFLTFPILAFLITLPYIIISYRKYGSIPFLRVLITYSFVLYLLTAFYLVILPLPTQEKINAMPTLSPQLIPFQFIKDIQSQIPDNLNNFSAILQIIKIQPVYQMIFNLILTLPFGVYLRYFFKCNFKKTVLLTFCLSLFFEVTQLTGLFFIYPKAYRLFDVDDLIINTTGGIIGYLLTPLFQKLLPTRDQLEFDSYKKGQKVSLLKRMVAFIIDLFFYSLICAISMLFTSSKWIFLIIAIIYYIGISIITKGYTLGKMIVNIKLLSFNGKTPKFYQYIIRYLLLYGVLLPFPIYVLYGANYLTTYIKDATGTVQTIILILAIAIITIECFIILIHNVILRRMFWYERLSKTYNVSTIQIPEKLRGLEDPIIENTNK